MLGIDKPSDLRGLMNGFWGTIVSFHFFDKYVLDQNVEFQVLVLALCGKDSKSDRSVCCV